MGVAAHQGGGHLGHVNLEHEAVRLFVFLHAAVIEDGDGAIGLAPSVVLVAGSGPRAQLESALLSAQPPYDLARLAVDLVDREAPAGGNQQVGVMSRSDGVNGEV